MRLLYRLAALGLIAVGWLVRPVSAQVGPFAQAAQSRPPATRTVAVTTRIPQAVDSMQRLTQPGFAGAQLAAKRQATRSLGARVAAASDPCNSYLCKGPTTTNTAPVASDNDDQFTLTGIPFSYTVNAFSDAETPNSLTYAATFSPVNGFSFNPATHVISGTPTSPGPTSVTITATDPGGLSASTSFGIVVSPRLSSGGPVLSLTLTASPTTLLTTGATSLSATAFNGTLPYSFTFTGPGFMFVNENVATVAGLPAGVQTFTAVVSDARSATATATVSVTVNETAPTTALRVLYQNADYDSTNNIIKPYLQLVNDGSSPLPYGELTLRYWLTVENFAPLTNLAVYYAQLGTDKVRMQYVALDKPRQGALGYVEYSFDPSAGNLAANSNSGDIQSGIAKANGTNLSEANDYSYAQNTGSYLANTHITAYRNGTLVWGTEPPLATAQTVVSVYSSAKDSPTTSQIQTRAELRNTGNVALNVADLSLRYYFTSDNGQPANVYVDYADIGSASVQAKVVSLASAMSGADSYVELTFPASSLVLSPLSSLGAIDFRIVRSDYGLLDQTNDYSYAANYGNVGLNPHITAYVSSSLVFGTAPSGAARVAATEPGTDLSVRVLGNPVVGSQAQVEVSGAQGQAVTLKVVDLQGRSVHEQRLEPANTVEQVRVPLGQSRGVLLLQVSTATQSRTLRIVKIE